MEIKQVISEAICKISFIDRELKLHLSLQDDLGIDSLRIVELILLLEEAFDVEFQESDLDPQKLTFVKDIYTLVCNYVKE